MKREKERETDRYRETAMQIAAENTVCFVLCLADV